MISYMPLRQIMKKNGYSQRDLIAKGFNPFTTINKGGDLDTDTVGRLCSLFNCNVEDLVAWVPGEPTKQGEMKKIDWDKLALLASSKSFSLTSLSLKIGKSKGALTTGKQRKTALSMIDIMAIADNLDCSAEELILD